LNFASKVALTLQNDGKRSKLIDRPIQIDRKRRHCSPPRKCRVYLQVSALGVIRDTDPLEFVFQKKCNSIFGKLATLHPHSRNVGFVVAGKKINLFDGLSDFDLASHLAPGKHKLSHASH
jgi:hypothetical protein